MASAQIVRNEYFALYHSTAKALTVAEKESKLPPSPNSNLNGNSNGNGSNGDNGNTFQTQFSPLGRHRQI